jgi:hypothetical protein
MLAESGLEKIGCAMCYNLRPLVPWKTVGNIYTAVPVLCQRTNDDTITIEQLADAMRNDFKDRVKNRDYILSLKMLYREYAAGSSRRLIAQLSSVGVISLEEPIVDFWGGQSSTARANKSNIVLINQSVRNKDGLIIYNRIQYSPAVLSKKDATRYLKSVNYVLTNIPQQTRLRDAIDELKKFQRKENL